MVWVFPQATGSEGVHQIPLANWADHMSDEWQGIKTTPYIPQKICEELRFRRLLLQISTCAEAEGSLWPQCHAEHVMLKDAYVAVGEIIGLAV